MSLTFRTAEGLQNMTAEQLVEKTKEKLASCQSEVISALRVWSEDFEGYGVPNKAVIAAIEKGLAESGWTCIGPQRCEKLGVVNMFKNENYANVSKEKNGHTMIMHRFNAGSKYKGPDGKIWWIPVVEVFDMRCFEWKDGKYVGNMVEINPDSDYAKAMVEVK